MLILNNPSLVDQIPDPVIHELVHRRFSEICAGEPYDYDLHGYKIVVEPGDSVEVLQSSIKTPLTHDGEKGALPFCLPFFVQDDIYTVRAKSIFSAIVA